MELHLAYQNVDTYVLMVPTHPVNKKYYRTKKLEVVKPLRSIIYGLEHDRSVLESNPNLSTTLKEKDEEIDLRLCGKIVSKTHQVVVNYENQPIYDFIEIDQLTKPDGKIQTRAHKKYTANINRSIPVLVTEQLYTVPELIKKYIFRKSYYLFHTDGIGYKFLYDLAQKLAQNQKMAKLIAFEKEKTPAPLVLYYGGIPFAGAYLEGKIQGKSYLLVLHLADREFILPNRTENYGINREEVEA